MKKISIAILTIILMGFLSVTAGVAFARTYSADGPYIGVYAQPIDQDLQEAFNLSRDDGIVIVDVMENSPADKAGLQRKDIIVSFDGKKVDGSTPLADMVADTKVGDKINVVFDRKGEKKTATIEIGQRPREDKQQAWLDRNAPRTMSRSYTYSGGTSGYIGAAIQDLNDQLGDYFGVKDGEGVLVTEVFDDSPASEAGIKAGDVITGIDDQSVAESAELQDIIAEKKEGDNIEVHLLRRGNKMAMKVEVKEDVLGMNSFSFPQNNFQPMQLDKSFLHRFFGDDNGGTRYDNSDEIQQLREELKTMQEQMNEMQKNMKK
jgi:C-terminal processing protease CtpA/Prc